MASTQNGWIARARGFLGTSLHLSITEHASYFHRLIRSLGTRSAEEEDQQKKKTRSAEEQGSRSHQGDFGHGVPTQ